MNGLKEILLAYSLILIDQATYNLKNIYYLLINNQTQMPPSEKLLSTYNLKNIFILFI